MEVEQHLVCEAGVLCAQHGLKYMQSSSGQAQCGVSRPLQLLT